MIGQQLRLDLDDGREVVVRYDLRDIRAWESTHDRSALVEAMSYDMVTWLGHHAAVRTGAINGDLSTYEAFQGRCVSWEAVREDVGPGPTKAKAKGRKGSPRSRGADSSAPSRSEPESPSAN